MSETIYEPINDNENPDVPATRSDLKNLATKAELAILRQEMNEGFADLPTKDDFSRLLRSVDSLIGEVKTYNDERSAESERLRRIEEWIGKAAEIIKLPIKF